MPFGIHRVDESLNGSFEQIAWASSIMGLIIPARLHPDFQLMLFHT